MAEINEDIADKVIEYKRYAYKGDLDRKGEILIALGKKYEGLIPVLKANNYTDIVDNVGFLLNNLDIRHNNVEGANARPGVIKMDAEKLEDWYDKTYDALLLSMMLARYVDYKGAIKDLKSVINK